MFEDALDYHLDIGGCRTRKTKRTLKKIAALSTGVAMVGATLTGLLA